MTMTMTKRGGWGMRGNVKMNVLYIYCVDVYYLYYILCVN